MIDNVAINNHQINIGRVTSINAPGGSPEFTLLRHLPALMQSLKVGLRQDDVSTIVALNRSGLPVSRLCLEWDDTKVNLTFSNSEIIEYSVVERKTGLETEWTPRPSSVTLSTLPNIEVVYANDSTDLLFSDVAMHSSFSVYHQMMVDDCRDVEFREHFISTLGYFSFRDPTTDNLISDLSIGENFGSSKSIMFYSRGNDQGKLITAFSAEFLKEFITMFIIAKSAWSGNTLLFIVDPSALLGARAAYIDEFINDVSAAQQEVQVIGISNDTVHAFQNNRKLN